MDLHRPSFALQIYRTGIGLGIILAVLALQLFLVNP